MRVKIYDVNQIERSYVAKNEDDCRTSRELLLYRHVCNTLVNQEDDHLRGEVVIMTEITLLKYNNCKFGDFLLDGISHGCFKEVVRGNGVTGINIIFMGLNGTFSDWEQVKLVIKNHFENFNVNINI